MAQNEAPSTDSFCVGSGEAIELPVIRFIGGLTLEPQIDPSKGAPGSCGLTLDLVTAIQSALAPFQPFLTLLDLVAQLVNCFLLLTEVVTNPFKIPDLLKCIPGLAEKIVAILALIPVFPPGIQAFVTFIVDVIRFIAVQIDCAVELLVSVQNQLDALAELADQINSTDDVTIQGALQELFDCGVEEASNQQALALSALAPIARILCTIRALLSIIPGGKAIADQLAFPSPGGVGGVEDAIAALSTIRDALLGVEDALVALTLGLGVLPPPGIGFECPLDSAPDPVEATPASVPSVSSITDPTTNLPISSVPLTPGGVGVDVTVLLNGSNFTAETQIFWGTAQIPVESVARQTDELVRVTLSPELRSVVGTFQVTAVNTPQGGEPVLFAGLDGNGGVETSEPFPLEVS